MPRSPVDHNTDPRGHHGGCATNGPVRRSRSNRARRQDALWIAPSPKPPASRSRRRPPSADTGCRQPWSPSGVAASSPCHPVPPLRGTCRWAGHPRSQPNRLGEDFGASSHVLCAAPPWASRPRSPWTRPGPDPRACAGSRRSSLRSHACPCASPPSTAKRTHGPADRLATPGVDVVIATSDASSISSNAASAPLLTSRGQFIDNGTMRSGLLPAVTTLLDQTRPNGQRMLLSAALDNGVDTVVTRPPSDPHARLAPTPTPVSTMDHRAFTVQPRTRSPSPQRLWRPGRTLFFVRTNTCRPAGDATAAIGCTGRGDSREPSPITATASARCVPRGCARPGCH